jgi:glycosyltransferase involved in cell wall biosynthesis
VRGGGDGAAGIRAGAKPSLIRRAYKAIDEFTTIPDKESGWIAPALVKGLTTVLRERPDVLYSTAPPWTGQVVALVLATVTRLPWVADFRDPWARAPWRESQPRAIRRSAVVLERLVIRRADAVLFATRTNRNEYAEHYGPEVAGKFHVVANGCDPTEFATLPPATHRAPFVILHAGSLYGARSPIPLFRAIASLIERGGINRQQFRLRLIGATSTSADFPGAAEALGLADVVEFVPRMRREEILKEMSAASCLLVLQPGTTVSIPGKLYEYFAVGRPVLALSEEGELADLVRASGIGVAVPPDEQVGIESALLQVMDMDRGGRLNPVPAHLYDGMASAGQAVAIIDQLAQPGAPRTVLPIDSVVATDAGKQQKQ